MENIQTLKLEDLIAAANRKTKPLTPAQVIAELTRRIDKREAAGKHPMVHVVAVRDKLAAATA